MWDILRDSTTGQLLRYASGNRVMRYAEEHESFIPVNLVPGGSNVEYEAPQRANEKPIQWYGPEDQENPRCWSKKKKVFVLTQIYIYSLTVYMASAIYTPSAPYVAEKYGVNEGKAILGMSMYVLAYGTGALLFSPLSEIPRVGRNPPYIVTFFAFTLVSVGAAKVNSFEGLVALRFIMGFLGSPALATAGASIGDIATPTQLPYFMSLWAAFATSGPALGPVISGFSVPAKDWRWSLWETFWMALPVLVMMVLFLPETSADTILSRRAARLKGMTAKQATHESLDGEPSEQGALEVVVDTLWRPLQINLMDPAVMFTTIYISLIYGIFYSFFECFPLVYGAGNPGTETHGYGMNAGEQGLIFLSVSIGCGIGLAIYLSYLYFYFHPWLEAHDGGAPEDRLKIGLFVTILQPVGLFIFAWTAFNSPEFHWAIPTLGVVLFISGGIVVFQIIFVYVPMIYPQFAASLFAANDFARSAMGAGAIHVARPLFAHMGIGRGVSLLGGLMVGGVLGMMILYHKGAYLRARSRFAMAL